MKTAEELLSYYLPGEKIKGKKEVFLEPRVSDDLTWVMSLVPDLFLPVKMIETKHYYIFDTRNSVWKIATVIFGFATVILLLLEVLFVVAELWYFSIIFRILSIIFFGAIIVLSLGGSGILTIKKKWIEEKEESKKWSSISGYVPYNQAYFLSSVVDEDLSKVRKRGVAFGYRFMRYWSKNVSPGQKFFIRFKENK